MRKLFSLLLCISVFLCSNSGVTESVAGSADISKASTAKEYSITFTATDKFDEFINAPISRLLNHLSVTSLYSKDGIHSDCLIDDEPIIYMDMAYSGAFPFIRSNLFNDIGVSISEEELYVLLYHFLSSINVSPVITNDVYALLSESLYPEYIDDTTDNKPDWTELSKSIASDLCSLGEIIDIRDEESALYDNAVKAYEIHTNGMDFLSMMENYNGSIPFLIPSDAILFLLTSDRIDAKVYLDDAGLPVKIESTVLNTEADVIGEADAIGRRELNMYYNRVSKPMEEDSVRHLIIAELNFFHKNNSLPIMTSQFTINATANHSKLKNAYGSARVTAKKDPAKEPITADTEDDPICSAYFDYTSAEFSNDNAVHVQILCDQYSNSPESNHVYYDYTYARNAINDCDEADIIISIDDTEVCRSHITGVVSDKQYDFNVDDMISCYDISWENVDEFLSQEEFKDSQNSIIKKLESLFPELLKDFRVISEAETK